MLCEVIAIDFHSEMSCYPATVLAFACTPVQCVAKLYCMKLHQVECFDFDSDGDHDLIGGFTTTVSEMLKAASQPVCLFMLLFVTCVANFTLWML